MEKKLHKKVKKNIYRKKTYTEKKLYKKRQRYIQTKRENNTKYGESCNKLIEICSKMQ